MTNNTDTAGYGGFQAGLCATPATASGAYYAASECRDQLLARAATILDAEVDDLDTGDGKIFVKADPSQAINIGDATGGRPVTGKGVSTLPTFSKEYLGYPEGTAGSIRTSVAEMLEIAVDTETGQIEVLDRVQWFDVGRAILLSGCFHQQYASMIMEHGKALFWEQIFDQSNGASLNTDYTTQFNPTAMEYDWSKMKGNLHESVDAITAYGVKGIGEPCVSTYAAFANAFYNATGKRIKVGPMYPAKVLQALGKI
jgi:CO/xanthine dehydrogenase Mo-binding subunit